MIATVFKFLLHAFRGIMQVQLMTMEAIFFIIISLHFGPNYLILLTLRKVLKFMIVSCCNGNDSQSYNETLSLSLSLSLSLWVMRIAKDGVNLKLYCIKLLLLWWFFELSNGKLLWCITLKINSLYWNTI